MEAFPKKESVSGRNKSVTEEESAPGQRAERRGIVKEASAFGLSGSAANGAVMENCGDITKEVIVSGLGVIQRDKASF